MSVQNGRQDGGKEGGLPVFVKKEPGYTVSIGVDP
jgi:hypothetical protein